MDVRISLATGHAGTFCERLRSHLLELGATVCGLDDGVDGVVHVASAAGIENRLLVETDREAWDRGAEAPIRETVAVMQGAHAAMRGRGGSIVLVIPSIALTGSPGLVPFAAAAEGIRLLGKSAARAWGADQIRVNSITAPVHEWSIPQPHEHTVPSKFGPSLADREIAADVAGAIAFFCGPLAAGVTGATMGIDSGTLLAP